MSYLLRDRRELPNKLPSKASLFTFTRFLIIYFLAVLLFATYAEPEPRGCFDTLAAPKYPHLLKYIPKRFMIRSFEGIFGHFYPIAKLELEEGRVAIGVNYFWDDKHRYGRRHIKGLKRGAKKWERLAKKYPGRVEFTPFTEHNLTKPDRYLRIAQKHCPNCIVINSPLYGRTSLNFIDEVHGLKGPLNQAYNYSQDGTDARTRDINKDYKLHFKARIFCLWVYEFNGKEYAADTTPRHLRTNYPTSNLMKNLVRLYPR